MTKSVETATGTHTGLAQHIVNFANILFRDKLPDPPLKAQNSEVITTSDNPRDYQSYFQRLAGHIYIREAKGNE